MATGKSIFFREESLHFLLIMVLAFCVFLSQNPSNILPRTTLYFDAAHYLETCKRICETAGPALSGQLSQGQIDSLAFYLMLDGPVLPGAAALLFGLFQKTPSPTEWQLLVAMQCAFQAACSGFIYLLARSIFSEKLLAIIASLLWIIYPATISSCNTFLTEPLACLLIVASLYFMNGLSDNETKKTSDYLKALSCGVSLALLALLKPALAPAALAAFAISAFGSLTLSLRKTLNSKQSLTDSFKFNRLSLGKTSICLLALLFTLSPWLSFTKAARGQIQLFPSRRPVYNITTGCNLEGDGWGCHPTHPVALMYDDNEEALPVALALLESNPQEQCNLALRKLTRLFNLPWNDYRYKILGLNFRLQAIFQSILLVFGFSGLALLFSALFSKALPLNPKLSIISILVLIAGHLIYLPFEGISRYGFTAMPLIILAAVATIRVLWRGKQKLIEKLAFILSSAVAIFLCKFDLTPYILLLTESTEIAVLLAAMSKALAVIIALGFFLRNSSLAETEVAARRALLAAITSLSLMAIAISTAMASSEHESSSWQCNLKSSNGAVREVSIDKKDVARADWALLLVDGDQNIAGASFKVNSYKPKEPLNSLYQYHSEKYELEDWLSQFASLIRKSPEAVRKWRAIEIPLSCLDRERTVISVESKTP
ncbi:MAG: hypothetical protein K2X27_13435, partial [Candidatus Obscuribacterales bacterium]|nr:hypothetical protein [Candidatus Obscuribacterales bacterium]